MRINTIILFCLLSIVTFAQPKSYSTAALNADLKYFTDWSCTQLNEGVKARDLKNFKSPLLKQVASELLAGTYNTKYKAESYHAYPSNKALYAQTKLHNGFSNYENITGIYLEKGEAVVLVGDLHGRTIKLLIPDWMRKPAEGVKPTEDPNGWGLHKQEIPLHEGVNVIYVNKASNVYIDYYVDEPKDAPAVNVHFPTGLVNGYFDAATQTNEDWNKLLDNAVSPIMDARGKHIQVAYPIEWFKEYTYGKGLELIANYDKMLHLQYTLMGLVKYNKIPDKRILARVNFNYYMFRDGDGVAYLGDKGTMKMVADPATVISGDPCWGFSHEVGHVMQLSPQITWGGMTEVSNNIFSMYTTTMLGNSSRLKNQKSYEAARKNIIGSTPQKSYLQSGDAFQSLVPFWQLHLHFTKNGFPDFYADVMETMRTQPDAGRGNKSINNMFEFIKICCDVTKTDLTDFFDKWGFFYVGQMEINDYAKYSFDITQKMVDDTKAYITSKNYSKPSVDITTTDE